jgi:hypothetical protein
VGKEGLVWGVTADALPLMPGQMLTLTLDGPYYVPAYSQVAWPVAVGSPLYVQVDSANAATDYGAVREAHEAYGGTYNNLASITVRPDQVGSEPPVTPWRATLPAGLPERP